MTKWTVIYKNGSHVLSQDIIEAETHHEAMQQCRPIFAAIADTIVATKSNGMIFVKNVQQERD